MPTPKPQHEIFTARIEALGGVGPFIDERAYSVLVGFMFEGRLYRWTIIKTSDENEMRDMIILACTTAICTLQCKIAGIAWSEVKSNGHGN